LLLDFIHSSRPSRRTIRPARFQEGASQGELSAHIGDSEQLEPCASYGTTLSPPTPPPTIQTTSRKRRKPNRAIKTESQATAIVPSTRIAVVVTGEADYDILDTAVNTIKSTQLVDHKAIDPTGKPVKTLKMKAKLKTEQQLH